MIPIDPARVRRILIRANNWIGDVVMISPAVRAIREHFRQARIAILAKRWVLEALRGSPHYDDLVEYDSDGAHRGPLGRLRLARRLRGERFDLAVLFQKALDAAVLAVLAGARLRVGYATDARSALLTHPLPLPPPGTHHAEAFLGLARALGCPVRDPRPHFHLDREARSAAAAILHAVGADDGLSLVAVHAGASKEPRAWHPERFGELGRRLAARAAVRIVLVGGPGEDEPIARAAGPIPAERRILLPAGVSIKVTGAVLERCALFVGSDSGPMHVAAALAVPTVAIFGPGSPALTAPLGPPGAVIAIGRDYPCAPCRQDFFHECPPSPAGKPFCLEEIRVDEVEEAALRLLPAGRAARA
jgi:lipopolysaccharide heptosyltransferase II